MIYFVTILYELIVIIALIYIIVKTAYISKTHTRLLRAIENKVDDNADKLYNVDITLDKIVRKVNSVKRSAESILSSLNYLVDKSKGKDLKSHTKPQTAFRSKAYTTPTHCE